MDIKIEINGITSATKDFWYLWMDKSCIKCGNRDTILKEIEMEMKRAERNECVDLDLPQIYQHEKGGE